MQTAKKYRHHPWEDWFARDRFELLRGRDFSCRTDSMAQAVRFAARRFGVAVSVQIADDGDSLVVVVRRNGNAKSKD